MFVEFSYKLYNAEDESLLYEVLSERPENMIFGVTPGVLPGLLPAMEGLGAGDSFEVTLSPAAAFGEYSDEDVMNLERAIFERDGELVEDVKVGAVVPMMTAEGYRVMGRVLNVGDKEVRMDFNHPFAGLTVTFKGEICSVREATEAELHPTSGCGGCGGGCGSGCGDGCDSHNGGGCGSGCCH